MRAGPVRRRRLADELGEPRAERPEGRTTDRHAGLGDARSGPQQRHRPLHPPGHEVAVGRLAVGVPEPPREVRGRHRRVLRHRHDVERLGVVPVHQIAGTPQEREAPGCAAGSWRDGTSGRRRRTVAPDSGPGGGRVPRWASPAAAGPGGTDGWRYHPMNVVRAAITQTTWTGDKESMLDKHESSRGPPPRRARRSSASRSSSTGPYFGITEDKKYYRYAEPCRRPDRAAVRGARQGARPGDGPADLRGGHHRRLLQHRGRRRRGRHGARQVPQAPHPEPRPVLGEVLLPSRQPRLPGLRHRGRQGRRLHLLRPALPGGLARARPERRAHGLQPERHQAGPVQPAVGGRAGRPRPSPTATSCCSPTGSAARTTSTATSPSTSTARASSSTRAATSSASRGSGEHEEES